MKIIVFGTRGIPDIPGGVETHCEMLYPAMLKNESAEITVICRSSYIPKNLRRSTYKGVKLKVLFAPRSKIFEAILHSFFSACYAIVKRPDIVHIHAIGPNLVAPLIRLFGLRLVMTHHGPDYQRQKWGLIPKVLLKLGEWSGVTFSHRIIVISKQIANHLYEKYRRQDCDLIPNGVTIPSSAKQFDYLTSLNLKPYSYILALGRFVPEKGFTYLIDAFIKSGLAERFKLVLAGDSDHETPYSVSLKAKAKAAGVILTGFIKGEALNQVFANSKLFVLPSFYEGLPITLLEAMANNLNILASDIRANLEVGLPPQHYFKAGDIEELSLRLKEEAGKEYTEHTYDMERYNWDNIAATTFDIYRELSNK